MELSGLVALFGVILGSTGIAGLLTQAVNLSRASRLRKSVEESMKLAALFPNNTPSRKVLLMAAHRDAVRVASMSFVKYPTWVLALLPIAAILLVGLIGITGSVSDSGFYEFDSTTWALLLASVAYILLIAFGYDLLQRLKRDKIVDYILLSGELDVRWDGTVSPRFRLLRRWHSTRVLNEASAAKAEMRQADLQGKAQIKEQGFVSLPNDLPVSTL